VWDWNGTLFHDNDAIIGATNAAFAELGLEPITLERYRALYCVPVPKFYERLMGRLPTDAEWQVIACELTAGVPVLLAEWGSAGRSQSILSMYGHDELVPLVRGFGIEPHFIRVDGRTGPSGGSKAEHMVRHVGALSGVQPSRVVVIGDAADDAVAARHVGAQAVLYTGGSHSRASLEEVGVPVVDSLQEAVEEAERLAA
jgi:phosphoglycolate phosphatase-like HAD superfamily hydrolase